MKKENVPPVNVGNLRMTRSRASALRASGKIPPLGEIQNRTSRANSKRAALDENNNNAPNNGGMQHKKRAVLQDVTNVCCESLYKGCFNAAKIQAKNSKQANKGPSNVSKASPSETKIVIGTIKAAPKIEDRGSSSSEKDGTSRSNNTKEFSTDELHILNQSSGVPSQPCSSSKKAEKQCLLEDGLIPSCPKVLNIDCDYKDPQLCSFYAADIYNNLQVAELVRRPCPTFMETIQRDITQTMRGILVDWLVEVSEEYKLVPDTLYLTVYFIDWFLSHNCIERQRLQLLGITCMLIASKYEEICAPRVEDFCFITDNTYTRGEVLNMEIQVLKCLGFQLFAPTTKIFLRRFLRAAQALYKSPSYELEYLANYLAELTLINYNFLNFLPSVIAASSVFLARWTLDQTIHPWNQTLEHYTSYKASDLKAAALALQDLQLNTIKCPLNATRMKYRQKKFNSVAALSSLKLLETLF